MKRLLTLVSLGGLSASLLSGLVVGPQMANAAQGMRAARPHYDPYARFPEYRSEREITATIVAVTPRRLTVQTIHGFTHVLYSNGVRYQVGQRIRVTGVFFNPATFNANRIVILSPNSPGEVRSEESNTERQLTGTIAAVQPKRLTVQTGHGFTHVVYSYGSFHVGQRIRVTGQRRDAATFYADEISVLP